MIRKIFTMIAIISCSLTSIAQNADTLHSISLVTLDGQNHSVNEFRGKRILTAAFNGASPDSTFLLQLKSFSIASDSVVVIAVPVTDSSGIVDTNRIQHLRSELDIDYFILRPSAVKKNDSSQHPLFKFLTHDQLNGHFNEDVHQYNQMFLVNEIGNMYAIIGSGTDPQIVSRLIQQGVE